MSDALAVDIGVIEFNRDVPDADGILWSVAETEDSIAARGGMLAPTGRHGGAALPTFFDGRPVAMAGAVEAPTQALAFDARERLAVLGVGEEIDIVWHETVPKFLRVSRSTSAPLIDFPLGGVFEFQLPFIAPFPFRRAVTATTTTLASGATVSLTNAGTSAAYPVVTATSSGTIDLVIGGRHFTTASVASGVYVDMWARTIRDGSGLDVSPWPKDPATEWLALPPGSTDVQQAGTAALEIVHYDTYA